jgi:hypothetical protein
VGEEGFSPENVERVVFEERWGTMYASEGLRGGFCGGCHGALRVTGDVGENRDRKARLIKKIKYSMHQLSSRWNCKESDFGRGCMFPLDR